MNSNNFFKNKVAYKLYIYIKQDLELNNPSGLIYHKTPTNNHRPHRLNTQWKFQIEFTLITLSGYRLTDPPWYKAMVEIVTITHVIWDFPYHVVFFFFFEWEEGWLRIFKSFRPFFSLHFLYSVPHPFFAFSPMGKQPDFCFCYLFFICLTTTIYSNKPSPATKPCPVYSIKGRITDIDLIYVRR